MTATTIDSIHRHLDLNPSDSIARLVLADALEEAGDLLASGYRALGQLKRVPYGYWQGNHWRYGHNPDRWWRWMLDGRLTVDDDWKVYAEETGSNMSRDFTYRQTTDVLPTTWHNMIFPNYTETYATRRLLEDTAAAAWTKLPESKRAEYLEGISLLGV